MRPDFFTYLPPEITTNILSRLSVRSIAISKCVCKPWLHLLETDHFIKSHSARSTPALAFSLLTRRSNWLHVSELEDLDLDLGLDRPYHPLRSFDFSRIEGYAGGWLLLGGSANGLLLLQNICDKYDGNCTFYVCNPITREFFLLRCPFKIIYGFGVSRISGQYKVVSVDGQSGWFVHTLGTESWRHIEAPDSFSLLKVGVFSHGNLHWMVTSYPDPWISCFDLETECFSRFTVPPLRGRQPRRPLYTLRDSIGFCDESSEDGGIDIWIMKEYGDENSWVKEYVIVPKFDQLDDFGCACPVEVLKNGDVLMLISGKRFTYYSNKTKTSQEVFGYFNAGEESYYIDPLPVTPSMVSLKCFSGMENVISF